MKKLLFMSTVLFFGFGFAACEKKCNEPAKADDMISELMATGYFVDLNSVNYKKVIVTPLVRANENSPYSEGVIEYTEAGIVSATIEFKNGVATCSGKSGSKLAYVKKDGMKYKVVVAEPLIKSIECGYIVDGIVKFYDIKSGAWLATFDYGNGICDPYILKTTAKGNSTFSMNDYPSWNK
jgi:hypothetical protein